MEDKRILVENLVNSTISINRPELRIKTIWKGKGEKRLLPFESLKEALYLSGVQALFDRGYLYVVNKEDRIALGFEDEEGLIQKQVVLTDEQRHYYLTTATVVELKELLATLSEAQVELLVEYGVNNKLATVIKSDIIKRYCGKDMVKLTELKRLKEED